MMKKNLFQEKSIHQDIEKKLSKKVIKIFSSKKKNFKKIYQIKISIQPIDLLVYLRQQSYDTKLYWMPKNSNEEYIGLDSLIKIQNKHFNNQKSQDIFSIAYRKLNRYIKKNDVRIYGGFNFYPQQKIDVIWKEYQNYTFVIPRFEIIRRKNQYFFVYNFRFKKKYLKKLLNKKKRDNTIEKNIHRKIISHFNTSFRKLKFTSSKNKKNNLPNNFQSYHIIKRSNNPEKLEWMQNINSLKKSFANQETSKVVLARRTDIRVKEKIHPENILIEFQKNNQNCYHFMFQFKKNSAFIGASPERLFKRRKNNIITEAIAGTRKRGHNQNEDELLEKELIHSEKDIYEHNFVKQAILKDLSYLCLKKHNKNSGQSRMIEKNHILKLRKVQHLICNFQGTLKDKIYDADVLKRLHPTPAVGGTPRKKAVQKIEELENFNRGWYASPVGVISKDLVEFAVGIRSALITKKQLSIFSGAGIVSESNADLEWEELESKISAYLNLLN